MRDEWNSYSEEDPEPPVGGEVEGDETLESDTEEPSSGTTDISEEKGDY